MLVPIRCHGNLDTDKMSQYFFSQYRATVILMPIECSRNTKFNVLGNAGQEAEVFNSDEEDNDMEEDGEKESRRGERKDSEGPAEEQKALTDSSFSPE